MKPYAWKFSSKRPSPTRSPSIAKTGAAKKCGQGMKKGKCDDGGDGGEEPPTFRPPNVPPWIGGGGVGTTNNEPSLQPTTRPRIDAPTNVPNQNTLSSTPIPTRAPISLPPQQQQHTETTPDPSPRPTSAKITTSSPVQSSTRPSQPQRTNPPTVRPIGLVPTLVPRSTSPVPATDPRSPTFVPTTTWYPTVTFFPTVTSMPTRRYSSLSPAHHNHLVQRPRKRPMTMIQSLSQISPRQSLSRHRLLPTKMVRQLTLAFNLPWHPIDKIPPIQGR